jgi:hypothetical protein
MTAEGQEPEEHQGADADRGGKGIRSVIGEEFSFSEAMGGWRGAVESVAPGVVFVVVYVIHPTLWPALIASLGLAVVIAVVRLFQRSSIMGAVSGLGGIVIGAIWAATTGKPENVYAWGLWVNAGWALGTALTLAIRYPLVGAIVAFLTNRWDTFRKDKAFMRRADGATWLWLGMFLARLGVQLPLYFNADVALLGTFKLVMGVPLFAAVLWVTWLMMRGVIRK